MACPKCGSPMLVKSHKMVCARKTCDYMTDLVKVVYSQRQLLAENELLKKKIGRLQYLEKKEREIEVLLLSIENLIRDFKGIDRPHRK